MNDKKKSMAKAMGKNQTLTNGKDVVITNFDKNNQIEKTVVDNVVTDTNKTKPAFSATIKEDTTGYIIKNGRVKNEKNIPVVANNPLFKGQIKQDNLELKQNLEKHYYARTFDDNLHIQIIYNILDIEKIITEYVINAVYAIDNIAGFGTNFIGEGKINPANTYDQYSEPDKYKAHFNNDKELIDRIKKSYKQFDEFLNNPRISYLGKAFYFKTIEKNRKTGKPEEKYILKDDEECYIILSLISGLRQWTVHSDNRDNLVSSTWLYQLDKKLNGDSQRILNYNYNEITDELTEKFSTNSAANLNYIAEATGIEAKKLIDKYFRFSITKEHKNIGFNITTLREKLLVKDELKDILLDHEKYDSMRSKLYTMMDFVILLEYIDLNKKDLTANAAGETFIEKLRASTLETKDNVYCTEAEELWGKIKDKLIKIKKFKGEDVKLYKKTKLPEIRRILPEGKDVSSFSKLMYILTMFLDGKEINDLLTTLINKFEGICALFRVKNKWENNKEGTPIGFVPDYSFFEKSEKILSELYVIKGFARMGENTATAKIEMMGDAIRIIGTDKSDDEIEKLANLFYTDDSGRKLGKGKHGMRNFIENNVVRNNRFHYLIRYGNPKKLHDIIKNENIVRYVLGRIADIQKEQGKRGINQIDRYYTTCGGTDPKQPMERKLDFLTKIITEMNYDQFEDNRRTIENTGRNNAEREKYKKIVSLYLTVIYHILKNLVNINSRYVLGFHCVERDAGLYKMEYPNINPTNYSSVTTAMLGYDGTTAVALKKFNYDNKISAENTLNNLERENPKLFEIYSTYHEKLTEEIQSDLDVKIAEKKAELDRAEEQSEISKLEKELHVLERTRNNSKETEKNKQINRERAKRARNKYLRNVKWNVIVWILYGEKNNNLIRKFRNEVDHLGIVRNIDTYIGDIDRIDSYFELYHYLMQRTIENQIAIPRNTKLFDCFRYIDNNRIYSKDLTKIYCYPFAYNLPRFKNLSIKEMFDMNEERPVNAVPEKKQ